MPWGSFRLRSLRSSFGVKLLVRPEWFVVIFVSCRSIFFRVPGENFGKLAGAVDQHVGRFLLQRMRGKAVRDANRVQACVPPSANVDVRVAYDHSLIGLCPVFLEQRAHAFWFRLLRGEAVATVDLREKSPEP